MRCARWFACDVLLPVADRIFQRALDSLYLQVDDTGLRVLDRAHPNGVKRGDERMKALRETMRGRIGFG